MAVTGGGYDYGSYSSYSQDPQFKRLQTEFAAAFGPSFPTFSWEAYTSDADYARRINEQIGMDASRAPGRQSALDAIRNYFTLNTEPTPFDLGGGKIDVEKLYGPLRDQVGKLAEGQIKSGTETITREAERARRMATEGLAGTGLGRSGVAAGTFQGLESERAGRVSDLTNQVRQRESETQFAISQQIADLKMKEELRQRGADEAFINSALDARRAMDMMSYQTMLDIAKDDASSSWWDQYVLPLLQVGGQVAAAKVGGG